MPMRIAPPGISAPASISAPVQGSDWTPSLWGPLTGHDDPVHPAGCSSRSGEELRDWAELESFRTPPSGYPERKPPLNADGARQTWAQLMSPEYSSAQPRRLSELHLLLRSSIEQELPPGLDVPFQVRKSQSAPTSPNIGHLESSSPCGGSTCRSSQSDGPRRWSTSLPKSARKSLKLVVNRRGLKHAAQFLVPPVIGDDPNFKAVKFLIGKGGSNMRTIAEETQAKLRVRGAGSGHLEGPEGQEKESKDPLMLCVSCADRYGYEAAMAAVEKLFERLFEAYRRYCRKEAHAIPDLKIEVVE